MYRRVSQTFSEEMKLGPLHRTQVRSLVRRHVLSIYRQLEVGRDSSILMENSAYRSKTQVFTGLCEHMPFSVSQCRRSHLRSQVTSSPFIISKVLYPCIPDPSSFHMLESLTNASHHCPAIYVLGTSSSRYSVLVPPVSAPLEAPRSPISLHGSTFQHFDVISTTIEDVILRELAHQIGSRALRELMLYMASDFVDRQNVARDEFVASQKASLAPPPRAWRLLAYASSLL
jgi:hypothetical protein